MYDLYSLIITTHHLIGLISTMEFENHCNEPLLVFKGRNVEVASGNCVEYNQD